MTQPRTVLFYQAPSDPSEHPMYVDAEGRNVPVSPTTLQPMSNASGQVVDADGALVPAYDGTGGGVHIDDVRIAVTSSDFDVTDENNNEIFIAYDGEVIPTGDQGIPSTTMVDGVAWAIGSDGTPYAPMSRVFTLRSYSTPVRADNYPVTSSGAKAAKPEELWEEYFDIQSIVKADRPARRGALIAWAGDDEFDSPNTIGMHGYRGTRYYAAAEDMYYQYWASSTTSNPTGSTPGSNLYTFDSSWDVVGGTNKAVSTNLVSADFSATSTSDRTRYFEKRLTLDSNLSYDVNFTVLAQAEAVVDIELLQWSDAQTDGLNYKSASMLPIKKLASRVVPAGTSVDISVDVIPTEFTSAHALRVTVLRGTYTTTPKVTLSNLSFKSVTYPIAGVGPRAIYDRPIGVNKIVIGVDYSADESISGQTSGANKPASSEVRILTDRGDGLFVWTRAFLNPEIDDAGKINLYFNGTSWGSDVNYDASVKIMGVQYAVYGMKRRDVRVNIMEISARRVYDVSDFLMNYDTTSEAADTSSILPFGTVTANTGSVTLSNHDGRFNPDYKFLLNRARTMDAGEPVFTNIPNPFYQMLNDAVYIEIDTATYIPGQENDKQYLRMVTARSTGNISPGINMNVDIEFSDDSALLEGIIPDPTFYHGATMSIIEVLYMLLDSVGFTSVRFADEDEHFSTHLQYFWTLKDGDNVWNIISDVCRSTQTVAFFDEYNVLNFKSLKGMYEDALSKQPALELTSQTSPERLSNIQSIDLEQSVSVNKIAVNYREVKDVEKTPSGDTPMEVIWQPEGSVVLRSAYLVNSLNDLQVGKGGNSYLQFAEGVTKTWPFSGMVQVEGEFIKYASKQYRYHLADNTTATKYISTEDERKELDKINEYRAMNNVYTGRLKITERGAEETLIRSHGKKALSDFTTRFRNGTGSAISNYTKGLSIKQSRLFVVGQPDTVGSGTTVISTGDWYDNHIPYLGTRFRINAGASAGVVSGLTGTNEDGIYIEVTSTEQIEKAGRPRGELSVMVQKGGVQKRYGYGIDVPISKYVDYDLDVSMKTNTSSIQPILYTAYYGVQLKYGSRGTSVGVLQKALNRIGENLVVDNVFGTNTKSAVIRLQGKKGLTKDGIVNIEEWKALEVHSPSTAGLHVHAVINGVFGLTVTIPTAELPTTWNSGRFGVFTRGQTSASFEHFYGYRGGEDIEFDESNFFDYISGGYVSDQLDAGWIYNTKTKYVMIGGKLVARKAQTNQLYLQDFGPYAHEIRDYDVVFDKESPALSSFMYFSNTAGVHLTEYQHKPFGAKFRVANKARRDSVLNGEDTGTFGSENSVDQVMMIYGHTLKINDERALRLSNKNSIAARGVEELSIDVDWIQSEDSAKKLASHVIESMSYPVPTYTADIFGNASVRTGQIATLYFPEKGIGSDTDSNRFFVYGVNHSNNGTHSTTVSLRQVIGSTGTRQATLKSVLERNNNAANMNPSIETYVNVGGVYLPSGYDFRDGVTGTFAAPFQLTQSGGGAAKMVGKDGTPYTSSMMAHPFPDGLGRFDHTDGDYFILHVSVTADPKSDVGAGIAIEGWPTSGAMTKVLDSKSKIVKAGQTTTLTLKGRYLSDGSIPEIYPVVRALNPANLGQGARNGQTLYVNNMYYRSAPNEDDIYPLYGGAELRKI